MNIKQLLRWISGDWWTVEELGEVASHRFSVWHPWSGHEVGFTEEEAVHRCKELNGYKTVSQYEIYVHMGEPSLSSKVNCGYFFFYYRTMAV